MSLRKRQKRFNLQQLGLLYKTCFSLILHTPEVYLMRAVLGESHKWARYVMSSALSFRAAGSGDIQRAVTELGPGLWPLPASSLGWPRTLLHHVPPRLPECTGLWVDLHLMVSRPVSSTSPQRKESRSHIGHTGHMMSYPPTVLPTGETEDAVCCHPSHSEERVRGRPC